MTVSPTRATMPPRTDGSMMTLTGDPLASRLAERLGEAGLLVGRQWDRGADFGDGLRAQSPRRGPQRCRRLPAGHGLGPAPTRKATNPVVNVLARLPSRSSTMPIRRSTGMAGSVSVVAQRVVALVGTRHA